MEEKAHVLVVSFNDTRLYMFSVLQGMEVLYTGYDTLQNVVTLEKLKVLTMIDQTADYRIVINGPYSDWVKAENAVQEQVRIDGRMPPYNRILSNLKTQRVRCIETGVIYRNASECANSTGVASGNLSKHLRRQPGYKRLKGFTFEYVLAGDS